MADVFDKDTKKLLKSVNTPDYMTDRYIISPSFVPNCESKYIVVESDNTIREMNTEEKATVDYVPPESEPTIEELDNIRDQNVRSEIAKTYSMTDELGIIREILASLHPEDANVQAWNNVVLAAKAKYPIVE